MADIDIVHKKRTSVWLWVLLAIVALAVIVLLFGMTADPQTVTQQLQRGGDVAAIPLLVDLIGTPNA